MGISITFSNIDIERENKERDVEVTKKANKAPNLEFGKDIFKKHHAVMYYWTNCTFPPLTIELSQFPHLSIKSSDVPPYALEICKSPPPSNFMLNPSQNNGIFL